MSRLASKHFFSTKQGKALVAVVSFIAAWLLFVRAVDTGSLMQYGLLIALTIFGINRLFRVVIPKND